VREVGEHNLQPVDLICGGFPCQPHSLAGQRKGKDDERNLWPEYLRIVRELRPSWVLGENVPGIRTTILDDILDDLEGLGYATRTFDIPACAVGAPHLRHRFFIVAHACCGDGRPGGPGRSEHGGEGVRLDAHEDMAHADGAGRQEQRGAESVEQEQRPTECCSAAMADTTERPDQRSITRTVFGALPASDGGAWGQWAAEPNVGRVVDGVPSRVDRLRALGNAVVPQVAELIGHMIIEAEAWL
jgi:DNA (cytosine-5)-methyltransferase 1